MTHFAHFDLVLDADEGSRPTVSRSPNLFGSLNGSDKSVNHLSENDQSIDQDDNNQETADLTPYGLLPGMTPNGQPDEQTNMKDRFPISESSTW